MSRWGISADYHVGNHRILGGPMTGGVNLRCRLIGEAAARSFQLAAKAGCQRFAILGDVFDSGKPSPEVIGVMADAIASSPIPVWIIPGNHDRSSDEPGNHALAALREVKNCRVCDEPTYLEDGVILAPFSPRPPVEYFREVLAAHNSLEPAFLLGHVGIVGPSTPIFLRDGGNKISVEQVFELGLKAPKDIDLRVFAAGDFHKHEIHEGILGAVNIVQVGALCQADFGDPIEVGKLCILDTEKGGIVEFIDVPGPRFITIGFEEVRRVAGGDSPDVAIPPQLLDECDLFVRVQCTDAEQGRAAEAILDGWGVAGWKIDLLPSAKQQSEVVEAVRGAVQVGEALREWVAAQPEPDEVKERAVQIAEECLR